MTDEEFEDFATVAAAYGTNQPDNHQWVGLSDEDIHSLNGYYEDKSIYQLIRAAEAKLKEKNT